MSSYGRSSATLAPHEAGNVWPRYFPLDDYVFPENVSAATRRKVAHTAAIVERVSGRGPFMNKNVKHLLRLEALAQVFPNALFLVVERDSRSVGLSLYRGRIANTGSTRSWWSVRPPTFEKLRLLSPPAQIIGQVRGLQERLEADLRRIQGRFLRVRYEEFCKDTTSLDSDLRRSSSLVVRQNAPGRFECPESSPRSAEEDEIVRGLTTSA
jgi:hypothetical protein